MYSNVISLSERLAVKEKKEDYSARVQLDEIMKKLFYIHNKRPIIDLLNSLYGDNIGYDAELIYLNKEAINESMQNKNILISRECDMLIKVNYKGKSYEYLLEFQTRNDRSIGIRLFRYSFELKVQNVKNLNASVVIELPNPYVIVLEENSNVPESYELILKAPGGESLKYSSRVLKYWEYGLDNLYDKNMYLLFPMKVFEVRKKINKLKAMKQENPKYDLLINEIRNDILKVSREILEQIDVIYKEKKIDGSEYNEFGLVISNLTLYLVQEVEKLSQVDKEVGELVKTFYDPKVAQDAVLKTRRESIFELLEDIGDISEDIRKLVEKEEDLSTLKNWHKIAAKVGSIDEFRNKAGLN